MSEVDGPIGAVTEQLRVYRIATGHLSDFIAAWEAGVRPLRRRYGFEIEAWTVPGEEVFVWLVHWTAGTGYPSFEAAETAYYDSPERHAVDPDPAQWITSKDVYWLRRQVPPER